MTITETAHAKINLTLSVGGKRPDGYHEIDSIMHSISLCDTITLTEADAITLTVTEGTAPLGRENLMVRAAELFMEKTGLSRGAAMTLAKRIPAQAGLGGGSSDAAAVLRGLARLCHQEIAPETLAAWGAALGADIPFCVVGGAARCRGIGERLTPLPDWPGRPLLIVRPPVSVSTGAAYGRMDRRTARPRNFTEACAAALAARDGEALASSLANDFEAALFPPEPLLSEADHFLTSLGRPHLMTGSGSAFFLLCDNEKDQQELLARVTAERPDWYAAAAETVGSCEL